MHQLGYQPRRNADGNRICDNTRCHTLTDSNCPEHTFCSEQCAIEFILLLESI